MMKKPNCPVIALEEHYWDQELVSHYHGVESIRDPEIVKRVYDLGELRLKEMDDAGIDVQVLSHGAPSTQKLGGNIAIELAQRVNDRLAAAISVHPKRLAAFAALPTSDPDAAARSSSAR
jgi:predicted TIM-barrel fold metal-dependent hydrolase